MKFLAQLGAVVLLLASFSPPAQAAFGREQPIYNVVDHSVVTSSGKTPSEEQVRKAIFQALTGRGWTVRESQPQHLVAVLDIRQHQAVVDINYSAKMFSITYKDSKVLRYDGTNIHRNYNSWIKNIEEDISANLAAL